MPSKKKPCPKWSMHPKLHPEVNELLAAFNLHFTFHPDDEDDGCIHSRDTNIMGRFACRNPKCASNGWSSKKIATTIRMYDGNRYNARVYHQRCKECNALSRPRLDQSYAERVVYWLKTWKGVPMKREERAEKKSEKPHKRHLCEGCKNGHCSELSRQIQGSTGKYKDAQFEAW